MYKIFLGTLMLSTAMSFPAFSAPFITNIPVSNSADFRVLSDDGSTIIGYAPSYSPRAYIIKNGVTTDLGVLGYNSMAYDSNNDGSIVVGDSRYLNGDQEAFRWTQGTGMQGLGYMGGGNISSARGISNDGSTIIGIAADSSYKEHAFRWRQGMGMQDIGGLVGYTDHRANAVNGNGNVIVGESYNVTGYPNPQDGQAFRWTQAGGIQGLGFLSGDNASQATGISNDGSVVIGNSIRGFGSYTAFRWTQAAGLQNLGYISFFHGGSTGSSIAYGISGDGNTIVGQSSSANANAEAFVWTQAGGMQSLKDLLVTKGVNMTGWSLDRAYSTSYNGNLVLGYGSQGVFLARLADDPTQAGITTPSALAASLASVAATSKQVAESTASQVGQSLFVARQLIPPTAVFAASVAPVSTPAVSSSVSSSVEMSGVSSGNAPAVASSNTDAYLNDLSSGTGGEAMKWTMYSSGGIGLGQNNDFDNHDFNGQVGIKRTLTPDFGVGVGVIAAKAQNNLGFDGKSSLNALGVSTVAAYTPFSNGLRVYGSLFAADLNLDVTRGYLNGAGLDSSRGKTDGFAYGAAGQVGWQYAVADRFSVMPYGELRWSKTTINGYNETGGAFAASFSDQDVTNATSRIGIEPRYALNPDVSLYGRAAWGHRISNNSKSVSASVSGLTTGLGNDAGDRNWAEGTTGVNWQYSDRTSFGTEITARTGDTAEPVVSAIASVSVRF